MSEIDLISTALGIWKKKWVVIATTLVAAIAGMSFNYIATDSVRVSVNLKKFEKNDFIARMVNNIN